MVFLRNQVIGENTKLTWATNLVETECDLWDIVRSLMKKEEKRDNDYSEEIIFLKSKLDIQKQLLHDKVEKLIISLEDIANIINRLTGSR